MKPTQVQLVQSVDGTLLSTYFELENAPEALEVRGYLPTGSLMGTGSGRITFREEIQKQPHYSGLCGPMYGGPGIVRYEDQESYAVLSA